MGLLWWSSCWDFAFQCQDSGLILDLEGKIPYASWPRNQNIKQKEYHNKFNKNFKNGLHRPPPQQSKGIDSGGSRQWRVETYQ